MSVNYKQVQSERFTKFPDDRIAFLPSESIAQKDASVFEMYSQGQISIGAAIEMIRKNNQLPVVTREQFLNEYRICGYDREFVQQKNKELRERVKAEIEPI